MKQTAVELLMESILGKDFRLTCSDEQLNAYQQAKQMERQQVIDANYDGQRLHSKSCTKQMLQDNAESYFDETYGSKGSDEHIVDTNEMIEKSGKPIIPELSDEEIEEVAERFEQHEFYGAGRVFIKGAIWYREQLKQRQ